MKKTVCILGGIVLLFSITACGIGMGNDGVVLENQTSANSRIAENNALEEDIPSSDPSAGTQQYGGAEDSDENGENYPYDSVFPQHEPYGTGIGAMPGRVVWTYDPASVLWDGSGYWWQAQNFDEAVILEKKKELS